MKRHDELWLTPDARYYFPSFPAQVIVVEVADERNAALVTWPGHGKNELIHKGFLSTVQPTQRLPRLKTLIAAARTAEAELGKAGMVLRDTDGTPTARGILADALAQVE